MICVYYNNSFIYFLETPAQADEASESKETLLLYPCEIENLVERILTETVRKAVNIAEWKKEVWSVTSEMSCLECLQVGSYEGVEFQGRPYMEASAESVQSRSEHDSIMRLLPLLEMAYCVVPANISNSVQELQEGAPDDIVTLCVNSENALPPVDTESDKQSPSVSEDEETIFMEDSEFEERELRSTTSDPSCLECLHIAINKPKETVSQTLSMQSQVETYDINRTSNTQIIDDVCHDLDTFHNTDTDDDNNN